MASTEILKKKLHTALKLSGFTLRREYCSMIVEKFIEEGIKFDTPFTLDNVIKSLSRSFETQCLSEHSIDQQHVERAIEAYLRAGHDHHETVFSVINAFDFPRLTYNQDRKVYTINDKKSRLLSDANSKAGVFIERYSTILQRTKRNFAQNNQFKLQTVDYLLTLSDVTLDHTLILGSILQVSEGKYYLEDPTGIVQLDLQHAKYERGFFVENGFYLVNGRYEDKTLIVSSILLPLGEEYTNSRPTFGNINYFGGPSRIPLKDSYHLREHMANTNKSILFFSDVWLDHPVIFEKLEKVFSALQQVPPAAFVFMGNFMSESHGSELMEVLKKLLLKLADLISKFPSLVHDSHFVFVPGLADPCTPHVVPRLPLPNYVTKEVMKILPKAIFATNPCRIQYCTREIVVFRANVVAKLLQGTLHKPPKSEIVECVTRTIISEGHLSPLSLNALPVHWDFDYCLRLYPLPDLVVVGDKFELYQEEYKGCVVTNPGSFCEGEFQFLDYVPFNNHIADCNLAE